MFVIWRYHNCDIEDHVCDMAVPCFVTCPLARVSRRVVAAYCAMASVTASLVGNRVPGENGTLILPVPVDERKQWVRTYAGSVVYVERRGEREFVPISSFWIFLMETDNQTKTTVTQPPPCVDQWNRSLFFHAPTRPAALPPPPRRAMLRVFQTQSGQCGLRAGQCASGLRG